MEFKKDQSCFMSSDGIHNVHYTTFIPEEIKAAVVTVHGMYEKKEKYYGFAEFLAKNGVACLCYDQLGHGETINDLSERGWFGETKGVEYILNDVKKAIEELKIRIPKVKTFLFGHSMGSFISRYFVVKNPQMTDGIVISGTSNGNGAIDIAIMLAAFLSKINGSKSINNTLEMLTMGSNNNKFKRMGETSPSAWITRDKEMQKVCDGNKFTFTVQGFHDMFKMLKFVSSSNWYNIYPKSLPALLISGTEDPIGDFGKGITQIYMKMKIKKISDVEIKLYKDCRHELINEINREEVFKDVLCWINGKV